MKETPEVRMKRELEVNKEPEPYRQSMDKSSINGESHSERAI